MNYCVERCISANEHEIMMLHYLKILFNNLFRF